jgi:spoIIIJ-associated protein
MPRYLEFDGINIEKAVEKACNEPNIAKDFLKYDIISYGSSGIFGLVGAKKSKIKVSVQDDEKLVSKEENKEININVETGLIVLTRILENISEDAKTKDEITGKEVCFNIECSDPAVVIGKKGQTLEAIQHIVKKAININKSEKYDIKVDVCGYLNKRQCKLKILAEKAAEKSKANGKPTSLGLMSANDRKIIHLTLKNDHEIKTQSIGDGLIKKIVIYPKRKRQA